MNTILKRFALAIPGLALLGGIALADVGNENTGYDSHNDASLEMENETELDVENDADIFNRIFGEVKTGWNEADKNTGDGSVDTGDASADVMVTNRANATEALINGCCSGGLGDIDIFNDTTGADSQNHAWVEVENKTEIDIDNDADVTNCIELKASTGGNSASKNTGNGSVSTGDASATVEVENTVNVNEVTVE